MDLGQCLADMSVAAAVVVVEAVVLALAASKTIVDPSVSVAAPEMSLWGTEYSYLAGGLLSDTDDTVRLGKPEVDALPVSSPAAMEAVAALADLETSESTEATANDQRG